MLTFCWLCPSTFFSSTSTISRFCECVRGGQYSYWSISFCYSATHGAPRAQPFVKVGGHVTPMPCVPCATGDGYQTVFTQISVKRRFVDGILSFTPVEMHNKYFTLE